MARVAGYLRVSTDRQAERGLGLEVQEAAIRKWARRTDNRVTLWTRDEGISGSNGLDTRVGLADALAAVRAREVAGVVVYRLDRLARDLVLQEQLLADIRRMGGELYSTSDAEAGYLADDPGDPSRKLIRQVLGAVSEYERAMIRLRMSSGKARKRDAGGYTGGGIPLGYRVADRNLVPDQAEAAVVDRARELRSAGRSLRDIARTLTEEGHKTKRGGRWAPQTVALILDRVGARCG